MDTYAKLYSGKEYNTIPDNKKKEFAKRIERLFQEGGMMRIKPNILYGKRVYTIHKIKMGKSGVRFNYNYFEENEWETAGFDKENYYVFSGKLGHEDFLEVMTAAYMLEEQYVEETTVTRLYGDNVRKREYIGWINYLFDKCYNQDKYYIKPITTAGFLYKDHNDMIYFWNEKAGFDFSQGLHIWFELLKMKFSYVIEEEGTYLKAFKEEPLRHIVDVMEAAEENYYHILTFTEFLEETKENIEDKRYWALWKIYEDMVFDHQLIKVGSVIFAPEGTENKRNGFWEYKRNSKKVLIDDWASIPKEKKNNDGRKILRRYMALMANKKLRCQVFGF